VRRFSFPLDAVLRWRGSQLEIEEAKLQQALASKARVEECRRDLARSEVEERNRTKDGAATPAERILLPDYLRWAALERHRLNQSLAACVELINTRRQAVVEARRKASLLENLRERRLDEWQRAVDKELEDLAGEAFLSRWSR